MKNAKGTSYMSRASYIRLLVMAVLSFISMYILMYAMVDSIENVYGNFNQFYMTGLMVAPMLIIELVLMSAMYHDKKMNIAIIAVSVIALVVFWSLIRQQTAISDKQFLRSMIPHHAGAILMCDKAPIQDSKLKELCRTIISSQKEEIAQMKAILSELEK